MFSQPPRRCASSAPADFDPERQEQRKRAHSSAVSRNLILGLRKPPDGPWAPSGQNPMAWFSVASRPSRAGQPECRAGTYCPASAASAISASAAMIAKPRARKMLPADATTLAVPTTGAIPIMIAWMSSPVMPLSAAAPALAM